MLFSAMSQGATLQLWRSVVQFWLAPSFTHPIVVQERPMHWNLYLATTFPFKGFPTGWEVAFVLGEGKTFPPNYPKNQQHPVSPCTYPIVLLQL